MAHANDNGTSRVNGTAARSPGSAGALERLCSATSSANGSAPASVPKNATRSRRRASADSARANANPNSTSPPSSPRPTTTLEAISSAGNSTRAWPPPNNDSSITPR